MGFLTDEKVAEARRVVREGQMTVRECADYYGVSYSAMSRAVAALSWPHVDEPPPGHGVTRSKISVEFADEIRYIYQQRDVTQVELAERFDLSQSTISRILTYRSWNRNDFCSRLKSLVQEKGRRQVAEDLGVAEEQIEEWESSVAPRDVRRSVV